MDTPKSRRLLRLLDGAFTVVTLLLAALLIGQCVDIFRVGTAAENLSETGVTLQSIYSREIVAEHFARIAWVGVLWLVLWAAELISRALLPRPQRAQPVLLPEYRLALARRNAQPTPAMRAEVRRRRIVVALCGAVTALCIFAVARYLLDRSHFASRELESVMGAMLVQIVPWVAALLAVLTCGLWFCGKSMLREARAAAQAPRREVPTPVRKGKKSNRTLWLARAGIGLAAAALVVAGIKNGGMYDVLVKAINICTECIGLG